MCVCVCNRQYSGLRYVPRLRAKRFGDVGAFESPSLAMG